MWERCLYNREDHRAPRRKRRRANNNNSCSGDALLSPALLQHSSPQLRSPQSALASDDEIPREPGGGTEAGAGSGAGAGADSRAEDPLEAALARVGGGNCWMWSLFCLLALPGLFNITVVSSSTFIGRRVPYWCRVPELAAAGWTDAQIRVFTTGAADGESCSMPDLDYRRMARLGPEQALRAAARSLETTGPLRRRPCTRFSFAENGTSMRSEWDLVCARTDLAVAVVAVLAVGKLVGALVFGAVSDRWGRKVGSVASCLIYVIAAPYVAIAPSLGQYLCARFLLGLAAVGRYYCSCTLLSETCSDRMRPRMVVWFNLTYPAGMALMALAAYYIRQWRKLQMALSLPTAVLLIYLWMLPESPRWLIARGHRGHAWYLMKRAHRSLQVAHRRPSAAHTEEAGKAADGAEPGPAGAAGGVRALLTHSELRGRLLICMCLHFASALTYVGLLYSADNLRQDKYVFTAACGGAEAAGYLLPVPLLRVLGRRHLSAGTLLLSGASLICIVAIPTGNTRAVLAVALIARFFNCSAFAVIILQTAELFPTINRNTALGASSTMTHVATAVAPFCTIYLGEINATLSTTVCGAVSVSAGPLVLLLPETCGRPLSDSLEEIKERARKGDRVTFRNCCACPRRQPSSSL